MKRNIKMQSSLSGVLVLEVWVLQLRELQRQKYRARTTKMVAAVWNMYLSLLEIMM